MATLGERVAAERKTLGMTQGQLAERVTREGYKISQGGIAQIERRGDTEPKSIVHLARALGVFPSWLQTGKGMKDASHPVAAFKGPDELEEALGMSRSRTVETPSPELSPNPPPSTRMVQVRQTEGPPDVPVWASAEGGMDGAIILTPDPVDYVRRSERMLTVKEPFAFVVKGGSMSPAVEDGDTVVLNPALHPRIGNDCVFIQDRGDGTFLALVKRVVRVNADHWKVRQFDPARDFDLPRKKWPKVYVVDEIRRKT